MKLHLMAAVLMLAAMSAGGSVRADLKIVERTSIDLTKAMIAGKPITPEEMGMLKNSPLVGGANGVEIAIYDAGSKFRLDMPTADSIVDTAAKTDTLLIPSTKQYMVMSIPANQLSMLAQGSTATVTDENQTKTILGHLTHLYSFTITNLMITFSGKMWVAEDLPGLTASALDTTDPLIGLIGSKTKGFPLRIDATVDMPMAFGPFGLSFVVSSVSTDPLPAGTFAIPSGYTKTDSVDPSLLGIPRPPAVPSAEPPPTTAPNP